MLRFLSFGIILGITFALDEQNRISQDSYHPSTNFSEAFDWGLLKKYNSEDKNVLLSPISLKLILALLYQGSNGVTQREFQSVLQFVDKNSVNQYYGQIISMLQASERSEYLLNMATSIFLDSRIAPNADFESKANKIYRTEVKPVNFVDTLGVSQTINSWVNTKTNGKVTEIVNADDLRETVMLVANAIYFKGTWTHPFPKNQTYFGNFFINNENLNNRETVSVPYMSTTDLFYIKESVELDSRILRLPYKGSDYSMFIILPNSIGGLPNLLKRINLHLVSSLRSTLEKRLVEVHIPKFKVNFKTKMNDILRKFGLNQMFGNTANFSGLIKNIPNAPKMLTVSDIIQKTGIEVDEEGSVVYSATGVNVGNKFGEPIEYFHVTHPFLFFIEGPKGSILFNGKIENPQENSGMKPVSQQFILNSAAAQLFSAPERLATQAEVSNPQFSPSNQSPNLEPNSNNQDVADAEELSYRFSLFDIELLNAFTESNTNVFLSPASIKTTLAMILEGATGYCAVEISEALRIRNINQGGVRTLLLGVLNALKGKSDTYLESSNAIFVSDKFRIRNKYQQVIEMFYQGVANTISFANVGNAVNTINNWVAKATYNNIREIVGLQSVSRETRAVILNALYFKGKWRNQFDPDLTKNKCFRTLSGCVSTPMMLASGNFNYAFIGRLRTHAVELPYENGFSMLILLPSEDASIRGVIRDLQHYKLVDILSSFKSLDITLEIPRFDFDYSSDLAEYLKSLKIREIFDSRANLSGIVENGDVLINSMVHKTRIEVTEEGTVAAAATGAVVIPLMGSTSIIADRPFVFFILNQKTIIFEGILMNPQEH